MSYRVEQKRGKPIHVYKVEEYWNPIKQQSLQWQKDIGKKDPNTGAVISIKKLLITPSSHDFGVVHLLRYFVESQELKSHLEKGF